MVRTQLVAAALRGFSRLALAAKGERRRREGLGGCRAGGTRAGLGVSALGLTAAKGGAGLSSCLGAADQ